MKKRICLLKWMMGNVDGGERVTVNLANELSSDYDVYIVSITSRSSKLFFEVNENVSYTNLIDGKYNIKQVLIKGINLLRDFCKQNRIDVILSIGLSSNIFMIGATLGTKTKSVFCEHINFKYNLSSPLTKLNRHIGVIFSDKIITLTDADRNNYLKFYKFLLPSKKIQKIYNWIELEDYTSKYSLESKRLVTVGRFSKQKGYDMLAEVANLVLNKYQDWNWDIYGLEDGVISEQFRKKLIEYGISDRVHLIGLVNGLSEMYSQKSIYVMTSYYEGLPLVLLEAKQYGLPVVSFDCPTGPSEIVLKNQNGYLIENYRTDILAEKISDLIDNAPLRERFSKLALEGTEKFSKPIILDQWKQLITELT